MSPNCNKLSLKKYFSFVYGRGNGFPGGGGRVNGRNQPPSCSGYVAQDFHAKKYNNEPLMV